MRALAAGFVLVTVATAALAKGPSIAEIRERLQATVKGQPISAVLVRMGAPDQDTTIAGVHLLAWSDTEAMYGTHCKLNVQLGPGDVVDRYWFAGERAACRILAIRAAGL